MAYQITVEQQLERIRVIAKLPNSEQSSKGKVKTHKYINRQNQSTDEIISICLDQNYISDI
jgi:hypothetical protein